MEAGLMEIVRSLNKSWIYDTYFSLYRPIHLGEKSGGKRPGGTVQIPVGAHLSEYFGFKFFLYFYMYFFLKQIINQFWHVYFYFLDNEILFHCSCKLSCGLFMF